MATESTPVAKSDPTILLPQSEYFELMGFKELVEALGIKDINSLSIGDLIKIRRVLEKQTIAQLAQSSGVDRGSLSKIEDNVVAIQQKSIDKLEKPFGSRFVSYLKKIKEKIPS